MDAVPSHPQELAFKWDELDELLSSFFTPGSPGPLVELGVPSDSADVMRVFAPFIRARIHRTHAQNLLILMYGEERSEDAEPRWIPWNMEDDSDRSEDEMQI